MKNKKVDTYYVHMAEVVYSHISFKTRRVVRLYQNRKKTPLRAYEGLLEALGDADANGYKRVC